MHDVSARFANLSAEKRALLMTRLKQRMEPRSPRISRRPPQATATPGSWLSRVCVVLDRYTGEFLHVDDPSTSSTGEVFMQWQWPLHSGFAFGWTGRILVFSTGFPCPVLYVTGLIR